MLDFLVPLAEPRPSRPDSNPTRKPRWLLTAVSEAVERYNPSREAAILLETASGYQV